MKNFCIVHILLLLIAMLAYQCAHAQDYLINVRGDTLRGDLKVFANGADMKVQVKGSDNKKTLIPIFQIKRYVYKGEVFEPIKAPRGYAFMKLLKSGYLSLYAYQLENQFSYDGQFLHKKDGTGIEVPNLTFKKMMKNFLSECPAVVAKVDEGEYTKRNIEAMVDHFNQCIAEKSKAEPRVQEQNIAVVQTPTWEALENSVSAHENLSNKEDVLDMIKEVKKKVARGEKVPNFLIEGLKNSLRDSGLEETLSRALQEMP